MLKERLSGCIDSTTPSARISSHQPICLRFTAPVANEDTRLGRNRRRLLEPKKAKKKERKKRPGADREGERTEGN